MEIILDGLEGLEALHDRFAAIFPPYYGRNLDALFDCLTETGTDLTVTLLHPEALGSRARAVTALLRRAAAENPHITLKKE